MIETDPPTGTPDLRTLAAEAIRRASVGPSFDADETLADAVLAAVLPAHRRQVLAEAADLVGGIPVTRTHLNEGDHVRDAAVRILRRLAAAVPETGPSGRVADETGPAVPEATPTH